MTETDLLLKLAKQVEQRRQIVMMLEEEMKNINQVLSDYVFLHKKISLLEIEDDVNIDCPSRYLDCVYKLGRRMNISELVLELLLVGTVRGWAVRQ